MHSAVSLLFRSYQATGTNVKKNFSPDYPVTKSVWLSVPKAPLFLGFYKVWIDVIDNYLPSGSANVRLFNTVHLRHQTGNTFRKNSSRFLQVSYPALKWGTWIHLLVSNLVPPLDFSFFFTFSTIFSLLCGSFTLFRCTSCATIFLSDSTHTFINLDIHS